MVKKTASIIASLIIMLAIGGFVFVSTFDLNRYKGYIEDLVYQNTGRKLTMNGDAKIGLSLVPTLVINDVTLANPEWAENPYMAKLGKLEVEFSLGALLHKKIDIKKFILIKPEIYLETSKNGQNSWDFAVPNTKKKTAQAQPSQQKQNVESNQGIALAAGLIANDVRLEDGLVNYFNAKSGQKVELILNGIDIDVKGNDEPVDLSFDAVYDGKPIIAEFQISNIGKILADNNVDFEGVINAMKVKAAINGALSDITGNMKYSLTADVYNPAGNFDAPEISLLARVDGDVNQADINIRSLNVATNLITGAVKADWTKAKPVVNATLKSDVFNMKSLSKNSVLSNLQFNIINEAQALTMVPNDKVPYQFLDVVNGAVNLKIGKLILDNGMIFMDIAADAKINNGILNINRFNLTAFGGKVSGNITANAGAKSIKVKVDGQGIKVADLYKAIENDDDLQVLSGGLLDFYADITTQGATYRKLSENLNGPFVALVDKSVIKSSSVDWLTEGVFAELWKILKVESAVNSQVEVECVVANADIKDGKATFKKGLVLSSDKLKLVSSGDINLVDDKINFTVSPTLNKLTSGNITQALASFIKVGGRLQSPAIKLDKTSAVSTVVGTIGTSGLYLGSEVLLGGDDNLCNTALQGSKYVSRFPRQTGVKTTVKDTYQDVSDQAREAAGEIGDAAKSLWKSLKKNLKGDK